ncbi:HAMP domain-containing sensor histidine kinase [Afifella sp. IM 167]|uniref:sensor histidine kinase n=1 Tax=Afifella sp. IM 167 TaxID=2033586 RepID=UPI001CCE45E1|nr:HAMP domain-containing sensor histidine kinase [Afifella sp. IM 167]MBZ8133048.1 ATP-binding protein [Afifella sp. IM 167]
MKRLSLRLRLILAGAVAVLLALALASFGLSALFAAHVDRRALAELSVQLDQVLAGLERGEDGQLALSRTPADPRFERPLGGLYWQIVEGGTTLRSRSLWDYVLPLPPDELSDGQKHVHELAGPSGEPLLTVERSVTLPERLGGGTARVTVAMDRTELEAARRDFLGDLLPYMAILALFLILAGGLQIAIGLSPLAAVEARVSSVRSGAARRLGADFPAEVRPLAGEVDALLEEREKEIALARARAGDLAHGLKTPLQALLGEAGRLRATGRQDAAGAIEEIAGQMRRHADRELARARTAIKSKGARSELAGVVESLVGVIRRTAEGAEIEWRTDVPAGLAAAIDRADLAEALGALVENAARHARETVSISAARQGGRIGLVVRDDGPGIPPERIAALMQRGARDTTGPGTGLGLAIAAEIAEAAGGSLSLKRCEPGLEALLLLPEAGTPPA